MKMVIRGMGWVTPLGRGLEEVFAKVQAGERPLVEELKNPSQASGVPVYRIPADLVQDAAAFPRLRRSSLISHYALAAAVDAVNQAALTAEQLARTALVFASSDGGVVYTRRFYADIVERGEGSGSPLLFPETVYNAPASHIAARLGIPGESVTLVGDAGVGFQAIEAGGEFLTGDVDYCLVCAAQELDWVTCEAYQRWRLMGGASQAAPFSEGAAALVLARNGHGVRVETGFGSDRPALHVSSASGTRLDIAEKEGIDRSCQATLAPKFNLGESLACSAIQQVIAGACALRLPERPPSALITTVSFDRQISALFLTEGNATA